MGRGRPSASASASAAAPNKQHKHEASFLSKLQMLREFVPSNIEESDLSLCLRQCACNVELAAEQLITGQFVSKKSTFFSMSSTGSNKKSSSSAAIATPAPKRARVEKTSTSHAAGGKRTVSNCAAAAASASSARKNPSTDSKTAAVKVTPHSTEKQKTSGGLHLLLCQRWVVGWSTTKSASVSYQESLELSHTAHGPPMVRFKGRGVEGTLQPALCEILTPILRFEESRLISIRAEALMELRGLPIGDEVPLSLKIFIEDPKTFFALFEYDTSADSGSAASQFFGRKQKSPKKTRVQKLSIAGAAYGLLQWAQYGDKYHFESTKRIAESEEEESGKDDDKESNSDEDEALAGEDDFEAEAGGEEQAETPEWAKSVVNDAALSSHKSLPEASDPACFKDGVELRPYQRQALHWMMNRESCDESRDEMEKELQLLSELARTAAQPSRPLPSLNTKDPIMCDVGPVRVSPEAAAKSRTIDGAKNPVNHPLWERRFLATRNMEWAISFYVNELTGVASARPPNPPSHCVGGCLADSMGLGKTVMLLALILKSKELAKTAIEAAEKTHSQTSSRPAEMTLGARTTLVVAPLSLVAQWEEEIVTKTTLAHQIYYGESATGCVNAKTFHKVDVVITTYGILQSELHSLKKNKSKSSGQGLLSYEWDRVILDEAHCIKNPSTLVSRACCMLKARKRWCVTGTPIQNSLQDVYSLLKFLRHEPWCELGFWKAAITSAEKANEKNLESSPQNDGDATAEKSISSGENVALSRVRRLLAPLILRRTKDSTTKDGEPILSLPPVEDRTVEVQFSPSEREFYNSLLLRSQTVFEGFMKDGTASKSWFTIFSLLQRLRQACDHVALTVKANMEDSNWNPSALQSPTKVPGAPLSPPKAQNRVSGNSNALDDAFLDGLLEKFRSNQVAEKENSHQNHSEPFETKYASNVAHTLSRVVKAGATHLEEECALCLDAPRIHDAVITPCAHIFCKQCLLNVLQENAKKSKSEQECNENMIQNSLYCPNGNCPMCKETIDAKRIIALSRSAKDGSTTTSFLADTKNKGHRGQDKAEPTPRSPTSEGARRTLEAALRGAGSSKLAAITNELRNVWELDPGSKVLIFSQFLGFLDLIESSLRKQGITHFRLDGKLSLKERVSVMEKFRSTTYSLNDDSDDELKKRQGTVLLVSMKAGGVGMNLVDASSVFVVDRWWNAAVEHQCIARVHRIGQRAKVVRVRKFVVVDSVEERIVSLQRRKNDMASEVLSDVAGGDGSTSSNARPTLDDFKLLFGN